MQTSFLRVGAGAAMAGAVLGVVFNLLHPRDADAFDSVEAELQLIADSDMWVLIHIMLFIAVALGLVGLVAIGMSMIGGAGEMWARAAIIVGSVSSGVLLILLAVDGTAIKEIADQWAGGDDSVLGGATALVEMNTAWLSASLMLFFGITPWLIAEAILTSGLYSRNLGYIEMVGGLLGFLTAGLLAFDGGGDFTITILFPITTLLHTVVLFLLGWALWNRSAATVTAVPTSTSTAA